MPKKKIALITGITGQDGAYLSELLLKKGYDVHGIKRRTSQINTERIDHIYNDNKKKKNFFLHYGDMTDMSSLISLINRIRPTEIYNLAAQSHVATSFEVPNYTSDVVGLGALRILEAIEKLNMKKITRFYQAGSSEMFGKVQTVPQNEKTPFYPQSPYAVAKLYAYWTTVNFREAYKIFAVNGILFNHEGPRRGENFVSRKITRAVCEIYRKKRNFFTLGNLNAKRDWGSARDYVESMWLMLKARKPSDYVIATGKSFTVKNFVEESFKYIGVKIGWKGKGLKEVGYDKKSGKILVKVDPVYFRPTDVHELRGDSSKAKRELKWKPKIDFKNLVKEMMISDLKEIQ